MCNLCVSGIESIKNVAVSLNAVFKLVQISNDGSSLPSAIRWMIRW